MDLNWEYSDWKPSSAALGLVTSFWEKEKPSKTAVLKLKLQLATNTRNIREHPYDPKSRFDRAETLSRLGYPELASGDFERALMLIEYGLDFSSPLGEKARSLEVIKTAKKKPSASAEAIQDLVSQSLRELMKETCLEYVDALYEIRGLPDMVDVCKQGLKIFPGDEDLTDQLEDSKEACSGYLRQARQRFSAEQLAGSSFGMIPSRSYPWMGIELRTRSAKTIASANGVLTSYSDCLEIRSSFLGSATT